MVSNIRTIVVCIAYVFMLMSMSISYGQRFDKVPNKSIYSTIDPNKLAFDLQDLRDKIKVQFQMDIDLQRQITDLQAQVNELKVKLTLKYHKKVKNHAQVTR